MKAPRPKKIVQPLKAGGHIRHDPYFWLRQRDDNKVIAHLHEENAWTEHLMAPWKELRESLFEEITGRIPQRDKTAPVPYNGYVYYARYEEGLEHPIHCRRKDSAESAEEILIDVNALADGKEFCQVKGLTPSPDNRLLAYAVDFTGNRVYTVHIKELRSGELLDDCLENADGSMAWAADNRTLFYTTKDETLRPAFLWRHTLGKKRQDDQQVYHEAGSAFYLYVGKTKSGAFLTATSWSTISSEVRLLPADNPTAEWRVVYPRESDLLYDVEHEPENERLFIHTNDQAKNFRLMTAPLDTPGKEHWKEYYAHRPETLLESFELFRDWLVLQERHNGLTRIRVTQKSDRREHLIDFDDPAYVAWCGSNLQYNSGTLRYGYTSLTTPVSSYDYDMETRTQRLVKRQEVVGTFDPAEYASERIFAKAADGAEVPVSLVYRKGLQRRGKNPCLLYGYGSYGISMDPEFSSVRLSLLDRGFIFAIAHIRGGQELGRHWYEEGKLLQKKNTFSDFIACAETLIAKKYTSPDCLFAYGGSAGGMLMGAVLNMRPDLWKAVVAAVPFVDVVTTMLDESIPLTTGEYDEWGNPNRKKYYEYMLSYSPYDNVTDHAYPAILVTTGLHDSQVQYWEPAKWVARLRDHNQGDKPVLLHIEMEAGHGGASGRFEKYKTTALHYAFLLAALRDFFPPEK